MTEPTASTSRTLELDDAPHLAARLFGPQDATRKLLERLLGVRLQGRGSQVTLHGDPAKLVFAERAVLQLLALARQGQSLFLHEVEQVVRLLEQDPGVRVDALARAPVLTTHEHRVITPKTANQGAYLDAIARHELTFGIGPAGTGKTYLAMAAAVAALQRKEVKRIILARPAVEAGEKLGFLPGNLAEKVDPYLRPLFDALNDMMDAERTTKLMEMGVVEVAPLAFMRGRTLSGAFVILDEAQNATREQMKMFLTRLGFGSRCVVTGDATQVDLPSHRESGLQHAARLLEGVEGVAVVRLGAVDVVRHPLVQRIVVAYEAEENR
jgi:phosphate starvation-inducible PhoH-like protein